MRISRSWFTAFTLLVVGANGSAQTTPKPLSLWYAAPAAQWVEAFPIGNGRLGAMVFGGPAHERIQFNESTIWTGGPHDYARAGAARYLHVLRALLYAERQREAEALAQVHFMSAPVRQRAYQAFGDLRLEFPTIDSASMSEYRRELDLDSAVATTRFRADGVTLHAAGVREPSGSGDRRDALTADRPERLSFTLTPTSAHKWHLPATRRAATRSRCRGWSRMA